MSESRSEFEAWICTPESPVLAGVEWASLIVEHYRICWYASRRAALEEAAKLCELRYMGDNNREDMEARRCAEAVRALSKAQEG